MRNMDHDNASIAPLVTRLQPVLLWARKSVHRAGHSTSQRQAAVVRSCHDGERSFGGDLGSGLPALSCGNLFPLSNLKNEIKV